MASRTALAALRDTVQTFEPDCVVAACEGQTWLEPAAASFAPGARQLCLGGGVTDPLVRAALDREVPVDWSTIYPERVAVAPESTEWDKNVRLASALLGQEAPRWWPVARVPEPARGSGGTDHRRIEPDRGGVRGLRRGGQCQRADQELAGGPLRGNAGLAGARAGNSRAADRTFVGTG